MTRPAVLALILILTTASPALAHVFGAGGGSFTAGLLHPFGGLDHLMAMFAVGLWASHLGGRALLAVPASFVVVMTAGFALALGGVPLPLVEPTILASVVVLGLLVATSFAAPTPMAMALIACFAIAHGHAHGIEFAGAEIGLHTLGIAAGLAVTTAALHLLGVALGLSVRALPSAALQHGASRTAGLAIAFAGLGLAIG